MHCARDLRLSEVCVDHAGMGKCIGTLLLFMYYLNDSKRLKHIVHF